MYEIYATTTFKHIYSSLDKNEKDWIDKIKEKFKESPTGSL